jgi:hypothetical protein
MKKILIAVPSLGEVDMSFSFSFTSMVAYTIKMGKDLNLAPCFLSSSLLPDLRNTFVQAALDNDCDYIFFLDADMKFPPDILLRLLKADKDIITTNYVTKSETLSRFTATGLDGKNHRSKITDKGVTEVALGATGTMLIKTEVFKKLKQPYFYLYWDNYNKRMFGEDYYFCYKAIKKGLKVWVDNDLSKEVFHIGKKEYSIADAIRCYPNYKKTEELRNIKTHGLLPKNSPKGNHSKTKRSKRSNKRSKH